MCLCRPHRESKPCSVQPACDANHAVDVSQKVTLGTRWLVAWHCHFLTNRTQTQQKILNSLFGIGAIQATSLFINCGVKELIMFIARANAAIPQTMYQMIYLSESNSERFNLFLCHVFAMYQRCSIFASFEWFRFPNEWFSIFFLSVGARA